MKWYLSINEMGTRDQVGVHAKLAVLSAMRHENLQPNLLYDGERNQFTRWMEEHGVKVIDYQPPFSDYVRALHSAGLYSTDYLGHWLRAGICNVETDDEFVLYTDCDVVFTKQPGVERYKPSLFACAPEFKVDNWNYFNSGVMIMNVPHLRESYADFEVFIKEAILQMGVKIRDQYAYNMFYRSRWERLDPELNWKPYWGSTENASILHFHGPKLGAIYAILDGEWNWGDVPGMQIGSLFTGNLEGYANALRSTLDVIGPELSEDHARIERALEQIGKFVPPLAPDLGFTNFRLFAD